MSLVFSAAPIYLDYAASAPPDAEVVEAMSACLRRGEVFANPSSVHIRGRAACAVVATAREKLAALINASPRDLIWTSGATESNNLAVFGAARFRKHRGRHVITMPTEHKSVCDTFAFLEKHGFEVTWLVPESNGVLAPGALEAAMRDDTQLVSIMHVNNETGVIQDIEAIGRLCRARDVLFHTDAAQSVGKLALDVQRVPVDLLSLTAHKFYGPQGVGALYIADRPGCGVEALLHGGGQERRLRPGTLALHQLAGLGVAAELADRRQAADLAHVGRLRQQLWDAIRDIDGIHLNGDPDRVYPGILNVSIAGVDGESLLLAMEPLCVASGSACNSLNADPSYVLRALGRSDDLAQGAIRFSFGRDTSVADLTVTASIYRSAVAHLRSMAPAMAL
jgi:cysteine desulfurase